MATLTITAGDRTAVKHIVFIHGLGGDSDTTWKSKSGKSRVYWPEWLFEDVPDVCIWSIGYEAPKLSILNNGMGLMDRAQNISEMLLNEFADISGELILVGHSLGGLVIKQVLRLASDQHTRPEASKFVNSVSGVIFLGTPHTGADLSKLGNTLFGRMLLRGLLLSEPSAATASLERNDPNLRALNTWYRDWCSGQRIRHLILTESKPYSIFGQIVKPDSADPGLAERAIPVDSHHIGISKPTSKQDEIYKHILKFTREKILTKQASWLKTNFGQTNDGWHGYDNWANCPKGIEEEYIVDKAARLHFPSSKNTEGLPTIEALELLRHKIIKERSSIRLVGLSGVGKTRFVQALFDERLGESSLEKDAVFYTDIACSPNPTPRVLVEKLIESCTKAILVVDNCGPDLHRELTRLCTKPESTVSVLTIEYDVREDQPEQTQVYSLEPSSKELIESMVSHRYPYLSNQHLCTISEFSGGNARVALALASKIEVDENISRLKDDDLFRRLFHQRHSHDQSLDKTAEVLSLVYSFQVEENGEVSNELQQLANVISCSPTVIYQSAQELKRRGLAQQRSVWMAILPHPIANRLAKLALQNIPRAKISKLINIDTTERVLKSFSRRIGYLDDSEDAIQISMTWLSQGGLIDKLHSSNQESLATVLLTNIAPLVPNEVLLYMERKAITDDLYLSRSNSNYVELTRLLRSLAYENKLFPHCFRLLCKVALSEKDGENVNSVRDLLSSLFEIYLSGTHATVETRLNCISTLLNSSIDQECDLGVKLLDHMLRTNHFSSSYSFDFGSLTRDYGYQPKTIDDINKWYLSALELLDSYIQSSHSPSKKAEEVFANHIRGLWRYPALHQQIEVLFHSLREKGLHTRGWFALGTAIKFDGKSMASEYKSRLEALWNNMEPKDLEQLIEMFIYSECHDFYGLEETDDDGKVLKCGYDRAKEIAKDLGCQVAKRGDDYLVKKLPQLFTTSGNHSNLFSFGCGLACEVQDLSLLWVNIKSTLENLDIKTVNVSMLEGIIKQAYSRDKCAADAILDEFLNNDKVNYIFPIVQFSAPLDKHAIIRLKHSLQLDTSPTRMYGVMASGRIHEALSDDDLIEILNLIWQKPEGQSVVIHILSMRFHGLKSEGNYAPNANLLARCRQYLVGLDYNREERGRRHSDIDDYSLTKIAKVCFSKYQYEEDASQLFEIFARGITNYSIYAFDYGDYLATLIELYPLQALDAFVDGGSGEEIATSRINSPSRTSSTPFSNLLPEEALEWCQKSPDTRFRKLSSLIYPYVEKDGSFELTELAQVLLENSESPHEVIQNYQYSALYEEGDGSSASRIESKLTVFQSLSEHRNTQISTRAKESLLELISAADEQRHNENVRSRYSEERFEW
ncbi:alpha/beta hydrolase [Vibrio alginolyticus]|nr:alpha/beta hydrolase [Vibrio alginolyticus]